MSDCPNQARSTKHPLCEMHYGRMRRYGALEPIATCAYCGERKSNHKGIYCSRSCSLRMDRARRYGLTADQALAYEATFDNSCWICRAPFNPAKREPFWDHDHSTGRLRGLLCQGCNSGLGMFRDRITNLRAAIEYLEVSSALGD